MLLPFARKSQRIQTKSVAPHLFVIRRTDNYCLFYMANERTRGSSGQLTMGQSLCLLSPNSSDTQNTDATFEN